MIKYKGKTLTPRQFEVLELIGTGYTNQEISKMLYLSSKTIESHIANIRTILSTGEEARIGDRRMVLLAKEMVDAYKNFNFSTVETHASSSLGLAA
jgi:FixJ family two-component response regulator